jgi:hypothetical protein
MILLRDDKLRGVDDFVAEIALAKRAGQRGLVGEPSSPCRRGSRTQACRCSSTSTGSF